MPPSLAAGLKELGYALPLQVVVRETTFAIPENFVVSQKGDDLRGTPASTDDPAGTWMNQGLGGDMNTIDLVLELLDANGRAVEMSHRWLLERYGSTVPLPWRHPDSGLETDEPNYPNTPEETPAKSGGNSVIPPGPNIHNWVEFGIPIRALVFTSKNGHVQDELIDQVHLGLPRDRIGRRVGKHGILAANSKQWLQAGPFEGTSLAALRILHTSVAHKRCKFVVEVWPDVERMMKATPDAAAWWGSGLVLSRKQVLSACAVPRPLASKHNSHLHPRFQGVSSAWKGKEKICVTDRALDFERNSRQNALFGDVTSDWNRDFRLESYQQRGLWDVKNKGNRRKDVCVKDADLANAIMEERAFRSSIPLAVMSKINKRRTAIVEKKVQDQMALTLRMLERCVPAAAAAASSCSCSSSCSSFCSSCSSSSLSSSSTNPFEQRIGTIPCSTSTNRRSGTSSGGCQIRPNDLKRMYSEYLEIDSLLRNAIDSRKRQRIERERKANIHLISAKHTTNSKPTASTSPTLSGYCSSSSASTGVASPSASPTQTNIPSGVVRLVALARDACTRRHHLKFGNGRVALAMMSSPSSKKSNGSINALNYPSKPQAMSCDEALAVLGCAAGAGAGGRKGIPAAPSGKIRFNVSAEQLFFDLDASCEGWLNEYELADALQVLGVPLSREIAKVTWTMCDKKKDGKVTKGEFLDFMNRREAELRHQFTLLDWNRDGLVCFDDLRCTRDNRDNELLLSGCSDHDLWTIVSWFASIKERVKKGGFVTGDESSQKSNGSFESDANDVCEEVGNACIDQDNDDISGDVGNVASDVSICWGSSSEHAKVDFVAFKTALVLLPPSTTMRDLAYLLHHY